ncbi:MAG: hypothetical protein DCC75_02165 [Proteobacteria bacterium]|nr:MAG: hypothetical protein DCC75_02165 [Pseudomonadota bacterium]
MSCKVWPFNQGETGKIRIQGKALFGKPNPQVAMSCSLGGISIVDTSGAISRPASFGPGLAAGGGAKLEFGKKHMSKPKSSTLASPPISISSRPAEELQQL